MTDAFKGLPCERTDCALSAVSSMSTCMGWTPVYGRDGQRLDDGDPNITASIYLCSTCDRRFGHRTAGGCNPLDEWSEE